jgi:hypothetical protein
MIQHRFYFDSIKHTPSTNRKAEERTCSHRCTMFQFGHGSIRTEAGTKSILASKVKNSISPIIAIGALIALPIAFGLGMAERLSDGSPAKFRCTPDGTFLMAGHLQSIWRVDKILTITLGFGNFSLAQAKAIDIAWDLIIGRGVQLFLSWRALKLLWPAIQHTMTQRTIRCTTYAGLASNVDSILTCARIWRDLFRRHFYSTSTHFTRFTYLSMGLTTAYILAFPTALSAMTSYAAITTPVVRVDASQSVSPDAFTPYWGAVMDASRIGLEDGYLIPGEKHRPCLATSEYNTTTKTIMDCMLSSNKQLVSLTRL